MNIGIIYKITNIQNNKVYIGQTIRPMEQRFRRHLNDALNNKLNTHLARAIRKYGAASFTIEQIDTAVTQDELTDKEQYWIRYYNSVELGYNETDAKSKCGGNTYQSKLPRKWPRLELKFEPAKKVGKIPWHEKLNELIFIVVKQ